MWASDRGNIHVVDLLLNKGANPNITSKVCLGGGGGGSGSTFKLAEAVLNYPCV